MLLLMSTRYRFLSAATRWRIVLFGFTRFGRKLVVQFCLCAQISSDFRHYCVSDATHCSADVCCAKSLFHDTSLLILDTPFQSNTKSDVIIAFFPE